MINDQIFAVNPNIDINDEQALMINPRCCYLIGSLAPMEVEKLTSFALQQLINKLEAVDSYVVMTVDERAALDDDAIAEYRIHPIISSNLPGSLQATSKALDQASRKLRRRLVNS